MFFHCQIWLIVVRNIATDGYITKLKNKKPLFVTCPPVRENVDKVGRSFIHSFNYSSISPSLYILPAYG
jgi:hypothetical protein